MFSTPATFPARLLAILVLAVALMAPTARAEGEYPTPSPYNVAWQFDFVHATPKRIVVDVPNSDTPQAYWYVTYTVTNNTDKERPFLPVFELLTNDGDLIRSDFTIPRQVFAAIKTREKKQFLQPAHEIAGELRLGEDQARDGVAIWAEPKPEMGTFQLFVEGLSGETAELKVGEETFTLRKELQLTYIVRGDDLRPSQDQITADKETWVMR